MISFWIVQQIGWRAEEFHSSRRPQQRHRRLFMCTCLYWSCNRAPSSFERCVGAYNNKHTTKGPFARPGDRSARAPCSGACHSQGTMARYADVGPALSSLRALPCSTIEIHLRAER